jgi:hypothetical protein
MTNTELDELLAGQPADVQEEILRINTDARPIALEIALLVPLFAALLGLVIGFRMTRLPGSQAVGSRRGAVGRLTLPHRKGPHNGPFRVAGAGFEPATSGL